MPASCPASPALDQLADFARWEAELHTNPTETQSALVKRLCEVPDRRRDKGRRHPLVVILTLTACATLVVGSDSITAIWQWAARSCQDVLARLGARFDAFSGRY
ncbi:MAG: transposase family protein, partial [Streptomycetaceae bacterium]|nr:transposase family protein [Streptomycetaceae bacterium]